MLAATLGFPSIQPHSRPWWRSRNCGRSGFEQLDGAEHRALRGVFRPPYGGARARRGCRREASWSVRYQGVEEAGGTAVLGDRPAPPAGMQGGPAVRQVSVARAAVACCRCCSAGWWPRSGGFRSPGRVRAARCGWSSGVSDARTATSSRRMSSRVPGDDRRRDRHRREMGVCVQPASRSWRLTGAGTDPARAGDRRRMSAPALDVAPRLRVSDAADEDGDGERAVQPAVAAAVEAGSPSGRTTRGSARRRRARGGGLGGRRITTRGTLRGRRGRSGIESCPDPRRASLTAMSRHCQRRGESLGQELCVRATVG